MAARVALLMAFTGFFAAIWNSDRPPAPAILTASNDRRLPDRPSIVEDIRRPTVVSPVSHGVVISSESDFSDCVLPEGISSGTYRVIDEQGRVGWISLPADDSAESSVAPRTEDVYVSRSPKGRWYFIRIEAAPVMATSPEERPVLR